MPITPDVARPIGRSASSLALNRIACACLLTSSRSSSGPISAAPTSSSSSRRLIAMMPPVRFESNSSSLVFLTRPVLGGQHQVRGDLVVRDLDDLGDVLVGLEGQQVGHVLALGDPAGLRQLVGLRPVDPALVGEEQDPVVGRADEEVADDVVLAQRGAGDTLAAALLRPVEVGLGALRVPGAGDRHHDVLARDEVLHGDLAVERDDPGPALVAPPRSTISASSSEMIFRCRSGLARMSLSSAISSSISAELVDDPLPLERGQPAQLHVQDRGGLDLVDRRAAASGRPWTPRRSASAGSGR